MAGDCSESGEAAEQHELPGGERPKGRANESNFREFRLGFAEGVSPGFREGCTGGLHVGGAQRWNELKERRMETKCGKGSWKSFLLSFPADSGGVCVRVRVYILEGRSVCFSLFQ